MAGTSITANKLMITWNQSKNMYSRVSCLLWKSRY